MLGWSVGNLLKINIMHITEGKAILISLVFLMNKCQIHVPLEKHGTYNSYNQRSFV